MSDFLFEKVFEIDNSIGIQYMNGIWYADFKVSLEGAKKTVAELGADLFDFCLLFCVLIIEFWPL